MFDTPASVLVISHLDWLLAVHHHARWHSSWLAYSVRQNYEVDELRSSTVKFCSLLPAHDGEASFLRTERVSAS
jgi:hypothetical protein